MGDTKISIPYPTVSVMLQVDGDEFPGEWLDLPSEPMPGDVVDLDNGDRRTVVRREFSSTHPMEVTVVVAQRG